MSSIMTNYIADLLSAIHSLDNNIIIEIVTVLKKVKEHKDKVFLIGNGGSSATPSHSAGDWSKELGIRTFCLTDNTPSVTAFANDTDYSNIFKGQLEVFMDPDDILIAYSGSGNSPNIINAVDYVNSLGNITIGITGNYNGNAGGLLAQKATIKLVVNTHSMERIEDLHLIINHIIKEHLMFADEC